MEFKKMYEEKLVTAEQAAAVVKSGDWVDYGWTTGTPVAVDHALAGGEKAYHFLLEQGFSESYAERVRDCISTHRYRKGNPPRSLEAKILFDADKLEAAGAMGIARTLLYKGSVSQPLYTRRPDGTVSDGTGDKEPSFFFFF